MNRPELLSFLENFSATVTASPPVESAQFMTMIGTFLSTVQTTKLGDEYREIIEAKAQSLADNGEQNL